MGKSPAFGSVFLIYFGSIQQYIIAAILAGWSKMNPFWTLI
jgi:hypothetical protein